MTRHRVSRNRLPWPTWVVVGILVAPFNGLVKSQQIPCLFKLPSIRCKDKNMVMLKRKDAPILSCSSLLPDDCSDEVLSSEYLIHDDLEVMVFVVVDGDSDASIFGEHFAEEFEARIHHAQPLGVFEVVVVVLEGAAGVVGRVDEDALDAACVEGQQGLEGLQIV